MGEKICKCGHDKKLHKHGKISWSNHCDKCRCSNYKNRKFPGKFEYGFMIFSIGFTAFFMILSIGLIVDSDPAIDGKQNEMVNLTLGELHTIVIILLIGVNVYFIFNFAIDPVLEIIHSRKRPEFPIE